MDKENFTKTMIGWWEKNRRDLPWRRTKDPYHILIAEILLRKTSAGHAILVYDQFLKNYPSINCLAKANFKELRNLIKPLGLANQRSKQLIDLAKKLEQDYGGEIPVNCKELLSLPGIGNYTSSGVRCLAFGKDEPMVDTNVVRIVGRYFSYKPKKNPAYNDPGLWIFVNQLIPPGKCKEFNLGLIDFVNAICTSKKPKCYKCVLNKTCRYYKEISY